VSVQPVTSPGLHLPSVPAPRATLRERLHSLAPPMAAAARGLTMGALVVSACAAAYAGQNLHVAGPIVDGLLGVLIVGAAIAAIFVVVRAVTWVLATMLRWLAGWLPGASRVLLAPIPALRAVAHVLVVSSLVIALLLWVAPGDGALAMFKSLVPFEILIVTGAIVGLLGGLAVLLRQRPNLMLLPLVPAVALGASVTAWAALPGFGDPIVHEEAAAVAAVPQLSLADPSLPGDFAVVAASYGSGSDHRDVFGAGADWTTPTVDASRALSDRTGVSALYADWNWGYDAGQLPINGLVWYPESAAPSPVVLIVHGNHSAGEPSDPGYAYLGQHLASRGMIAVSVDENYLNGDAFFDFGGHEQGLRAWLLLRHLDLFRSWNADPTHPLAGRVDLDRVALIGHSRGGEAAAVAAALEAGDAELSGLPDVPRGFGIRAVIGLAPSDRQYAGPLAPISLTDVDYLVMQGAHDADLPAFTGLQTYHRVSFTGRGDHLKVALYSQRANHGRFSTVWDTGDAGPLTSWMLDRGSILSMDEQQQLARAAIGAFLARSLFDETSYDAFFADPRSGRAWLPDDVVLTHWESSERVVAADFDDGLVNGGSIAATGFDSVLLRDPLLRDRATQDDRAVLLSWSDAASYRIALEPQVRAGIDPDGRLVLSIAAGDEGVVPDPWVELRTADGGSATVQLDDLVPLRPPLPTRLWKLDWLGDRYLPTERLHWPAEHFLQTYAVPLSAFVEVTPDLDLERLEEVVIHVAGSGSMYLDDVAFEPG